MKLSVSSAFVVLAFSAFVHAAPRGGGNDNNNQQCDNNGNNGGNGGGVQTITVTADPVTVTITSAAASQTGSAGNNGSGNSNAGGNNNNAGNGNDNSGSNAGGNDNAGGNGNGNANNGAGNANAGGSGNNGAGNNNGNGTAAGNAGGNAGGNGGDDLQTSLTLDSSLIGANLAQTGLGVNGSEAGQVASDTSTNNFINFCASVPNLPITNGLQIPTGSCNPVPMGIIIAKAQMPSAKFTSPPNFGTVAPNTAFTISMAVSNMETGNFVNPNVNYFAAPQKVNAQGQVVAHSHVVVEQVQSFTDTAVLDPTKFAFFKGLNAPAQGGVLTASVDKGLPAGTYRLASINTAANHQPALVSVAQHGSLDDIIYFTVGDAAANATAPAAAPAGNDTATATDSASAAATDSASASATDAASASGSAAATSAAASASASDAASASAAAPASATASASGSAGAAAPSDSAAAGPASASASASSSAAAPSDSAAAGGQGDNNGGDNKDGNGKNDNGKGKRTVRVSRRSRL